MGFAAEEDRSGAGESCPVPGDRPLRPGGDHAAARARAPLNRLCDVGARELHGEDRAEARPDDRRIGRIGPRVADDHAGEPGGVGGAEDGAEISRLLDPLDDQHRSVGKRRPVSERAGAEADDADAAFVAAAEGQLLECWPRQERDPRAPRNHLGEPTVEIGSRRQACGIGIVSAGISPGEDRLI